MSKIFNDQGIMRARIITPGQGSTGYYSPALLEKAAPKFDGAQVYWDHPTKTEEAARPERSLRDLAGKIQPGTAKWEAAGKHGAGIYADVQVFKPFQEHVNELGPHIGMSIRASGQGKAGKVAGKDTVIVESIDSVQSVDFVTLPGRGGKVLQMFEAARGANTQNQEVEMTEAEVKTLVEGAVKQAVAVALTEATKPVAELTQRALRGDAQVEATKVLSGITLPEASKARVIEAAIQNLPLKEGALDIEKFTALVIAEAKREGQYVASITGSGKVISMGAPAPSKEEREAQAERLKESADHSVDVFKRLGLSEAGAKAAAKGRVA